MARTRSARAHEQVLEAALHLFAERGIDATSMDAIAAASGVSKATIYNHWPDKDALCLEVMAHAHGLDDAPPRPLSDDLRAAMVEVLSRRPRAGDDERRKRLMPHFVAYAARNPAFGAAWRARVMEPPQRELKKLLRRGVEEGIFPADLNYETSLALLIGPMMYGYFLTQTMSQRLPPGLPERVVETFWKAHAVVRPARRHAVSSRRAKPEKR